MAPKSAVKPVGSRGCHTIKDRSPKELRRASKKKELLDGICATDAKRVRRLQATATRLGMGWSREYTAGDLGSIPSGSLFEESQVCTSMSQDESQVAAHGVVEESQVAETLEDSQGPPQDEVSVFEQVAPPQPADDGYSPDHLPHEEAPPSQEEEGEEEEHAEADPAKLSEAEKIEIEISQAQEQAEAEADPAKLSEAEKIAMFESALSAGVPCVYTVERLHDLGYKYVLGGTMRIGASSYLTGINFQQVTMLDENRVASGAATGASSSSGAATGASGAATVASGAATGATVQTDIEIESSQEAIDESLT
jgi:hypothetical protein